MNKVMLGALSLMFVLQQVPFAFGEEPGAQDQMGLPPARQIPGITAEDPFPRGCIDCHINMPERNQDERLSTLMSKWNEDMEPELLALAQALAPEGVTLKGVHPKATNSLADIPAGCISCHDKLHKKAPAFAPLVHSIHLTGGEENHFLTIFQGECTHCHKMDKQTGMWAIPTGPEQ